MQSASLVRRLSWQLHSGELVSSLSVQRSEWNIWKQVCYFTLLDRLTLSLSVLLNINFHHQLTSPNIRKYTHTHTDGCTLLPEITQDVVFLAWRFPENRGSVFGDMWRERIMKSERVSWTRQRGQFSISGKQWQLCQLSIIILRLFICATPNSSLSHCLLPLSSFSHRRRNFEIWRNANCTMIMDCQIVIHLSWTVLVVWDEEAWGLEKWTYWHINFPPMHKYLLAIGRKMQTDLFSVSVFML